MNIRPSILTAILLLLTLKTYGQYKATLPADSGALHHRVLALKAELLNMVNPVDPTLLFSLEYFFTPQYTISQDLGWVVGIRGEEDPYHHAYGFKVREELRYYTPAHPGKPWAYVGVSLGYRYVAIEDDFIIGHGCSDSYSYLYSCEYVQYVRGKLNTHQYAAYAKAGVAYPLGEQLTLEVDVGLGVQYFAMESLTDSGEIIHEYDYHSFYDEENEGWATYAAVNAKVGYTIAAKKK